MFQLFVYYKCKQTVRKTTLTCYIFLTKYFSLAFSAFWPCKDQKIWPSHMNLGKTHPKKYFYDEKKILLKSHCHLYCCCCLIHCCIQYDCCWKRFQQQIWILYCWTTFAVRKFGNGPIKMFQLNWYQLKMGPYLRKHT